MPIHFKLHGDQVRVRYSGRYFNEYKAVIASFSFARFDLSSKSWVFPINLFHRIIPILGTLPEPADIQRELYEKIIDDRAAVEKAKSIRKEIECDFVPDGLKEHIRLLPFQAIGSKYFVQAKRGVVGDDVGLGKTVQAISAFVHLLESDEINSVLIIAPGHLKRQWAKEIDKFSFWEPTLIEGTPAQRKWKFGNATEIIITNYELLCRDPEYFAREWGVVVLDEIQEIKNYRTKAAKLCRKLRCRYKWGLTATVLENNLPELHSIFEFIAPGVLGRWQEFERRFVIRNFFGGIKGYRDLESLKKKIAPYLLRRRVDDCLSDFPVKQSKIRRLDFLPQEKVIYQDVNKQVIRNISEGRMDQINKSQRMNQVGYLRQACDHTCLISKEYNYPSAKLEWLKELLQEVADRGEKAVVFSEWSRMVMKIRDELDGNCQILHGQMNFAARNSAIEEWKKSDEPLICTDCANVGLNLQDANWLINYEMHWNPAVMKQRSGRVHRLTQTRKVHVRAPIMNGSVEEKVLEALSGKVDLFTSVIDALASQAKKVSRNDRRPVK